MERPSWLCLKVLRWFHFLKSRQRNAKNLLSTVQLPKNAKWQTQLKKFSFIPILYQIKTYFFAVTATRNLSQLYKKPNSKQQAIKNCLLLPSPLEPQCQLSHKNSSRLRSHSARRPLEDTPELPQVQNSLPHLPIKDYPPHQISLMREIISLKVHFI